MAVQTDLTGVVSWELGGEHDQRRGREAFILPPVWARELGLTSLVGEEMELLQIPDHAEFFWEVWQRAAVQGGERAVRKTAHNPFVYPHNLNVRVIASVSKDEHGRPYECFRMTYSEAKEDGLIAGRWLTLRSGGRCPSVARVDLCSGTVRCFMENAGPDTLRLEEVKPDDPIFGERLSELRTLAILDGLNYSPEFDAIASQFARKPAGAFVCTCYHRSLGETMPHETELAALR